MEDDIFHKVVLTCEPPKSLIKLLKLKNIYICKTQWRILCQVLGETKAINLGAGDGGEGGVQREAQERELIPGHWGWIRVQFNQILTGQVPWVTWIHKFSISGQ